MISALESFGGKMARVFARDMDALIAGRQRAEIEYADPEMHERLAAIEPIVRRARVIAVTHREDPDEGRLHVFLRNPGTAGLPRRLFACVLRPAMDVETEVGRAGFFVETADDQALWPAATPTPDVVRAAIQGWIERSYANVSVPEIVLDPWAGEVGDARRSFEVIVERLSVASVQLRRVRGVLEAPDLVHPRPDIAKTA